MKIIIRKGNQKEEYRIPDWLANQKQFITMQNTNMEEIEVDFVRETEKAICVLADQLIGNVWIPKSQLQEWKYDNPSLVKSILEFHGKDASDEIILNAVGSESIKEFGRENILKNIRYEMNKLY